MNKKIYLLTVVALMAQYANAQVVYRNYYDKSGALTDSLNSYWYTEIETNESNKFFSFYTVNNKVRSKVVRDSFGAIKLYYHVNGSTKAEIIEDKAGRAESIKVYYPDGKLQAELRSEESVPGSKGELRTYILNYWDSVGTQIVAEGNGVCRCVLTPEDDLPYLESGPVVDKLKDGVWIGIGSNNKTFEEHYVNGVLSQGTFHDSDGKVYQYAEVYENAEPNRGLVSFYEYVGDNLEYPVKSRRRGIEGRVYVEFVVQKDGSITDLNVIKGIGKECDEEAVRVIGSSENWSPGKVRGKTVKQRFVLPIEFKLN